VERFALREVLRFIFVRARRDEMSEDEFDKQFKEMQKGAMTVGKGLAVFSVGAGVIALAGMIALALVAWHFLQKIW
jgi:hypothetical protein